MLRTAVPVAATSPASRAPPVVAFALSEFVGGTQLAGEPPGEDQIDRSAHAGLEKTVDPAKVGHLGGRRGRRRERTSTAALRPVPARRRVRARLDGCA